jgi:hypothetical protein
MDKCSARLTSDVRESPLFTSWNPEWGGETLPPVTVLDDRLVLIDRLVDPRPCTERRKGERLKEIRREKERGVTWLDFGSDSTIRYGGAMIKQRSDLHGFRM